MKGPKNFSLRALTPISEGELKDFYNMVSRIVNYWNCTLEVDGAKMSLHEFNDGFGDMLEFNNRFLKKQISEILEKQEPLVFFSAMYPLTFGVKEAAATLENPEYFGQWMNEKQSEDFYYAVPQFFSTPNGVRGVYVLTENWPSIFPLKPDVPFGIIDPATRKPLVCDSYEIGFYNSSAETLGSISYGKFMENLAPEFISYFDADHILIEPFSADDMRNFLEKFSQ